MKLNASQLDGIVHNALSTAYDENGGLHFYRFTESQRETYAAESADWVKKTLSGASVTLDFLTDSDFITLKFDLFPGSSQKWGSIDLYVDGVFYADRYAADLSIKLAGFDLPAGQHRVTVYLPWSAETVLHEVHLSDGATVLPVKRSCKLLCFGDSITQGYLTKFTSLSYVNQTARALDAEVVNQGIGGYIFNDATLDESICAYQPDLITVAYGTNDYSHYETAEEYGEHSGRYIRKLAALFPDTKIVGILPLYRNDENHQARKKYRAYSLDDVRQVLQDQYAALPHGYVIRETGIPHIPQAYAADYLHPNEFGFSVMSREIIRQLQEILAK